MKKILLSAGLAIAGFWPGLALAHVEVLPETVEPAAFQTFTMGVPNEKDQATTELTLQIPDGLKYVTPTVKPGWTITTKTRGTGEAAEVTAITWAAGSVPEGQRDDFTFSAQAPAKAGSLNWKVAQTYADGTVVAWDQKPTNDHTEGSTPYSITTVAEPATAAQPANSSQSNVALVISVIAFVLALGLLFENASNYAAISRR